MFQDGVKAFIRAMTWTSHFILISIVECLDTWHLLKALNTEVIAQRTYERSRHN